MHPRLPIVSILAVFAVPLGCPGAEARSALLTAQESISAAELQQHIDVLAADSFEGREAGRQGGRAAGAYIQQKLRKLGIRPAGDSGSFFQDFSSGYRNVLAAIPGHDPDLAHEYIVLSGHYDHVGYGSKQTSQGPVGYIHNGADDNASGVSVLLELVEALQNCSDALPRSVLVAFWDAEEKGLLGAKHWLGHPTFDVDVREIQSLVNVDMVGRLQASKGLSLFGTRSQPGLRRAWSQANVGGDLLLRFPWKTVDNSDHYPFLEHSIPAVMVHTGLHDDYHRPSDDAHKLNGDGMKAISDLLLNYVVAAANNPSSAAFRAECLTESARDQRAFERDNETHHIRLGIMWDTSDEDKGEGVLVRGVWDDSPAEREGIRQGDRLTTINGEELTGIDVLRRTVALSDTVELGIARGEEILQKRVQLQGQPIRLGISWRTDEAEPNSVVLSGIVPGSPASFANLKRLDRIQQINGQPVIPDEFKSAIGSASGTVELLVERDGRMLVVPLVIPEA